MKFKFAIVFIAVGLCSPVMAQQGWQELSSLQHARVEGAAVLFNDELYVFNGFGAGLKIANSVEKYNHRRNQWRLLGATSTGQANAVTHAAAVRVGEEVWLVGGRVGNHPGRVSNKVRVFNLRSSQWRAGADLPKPFAGGGAAEIDGKLHVFGGVDAQASCDVANHFVLDLNSLSGGWQDITGRAGMPEPRNHFATAVYANKIYAIGGQHGHDGCGGGRDVSLVHEFDPASQRWQRRADLPQAQSHSEPSTFTHNGFIYTMGGEVGQGNKVLRYDPRADQWQQIATLAEKLIAPAARIIDNVLVVAGGGAPRAQTPTRKTRSMTLMSVGDEPAASVNGVDNPSEIASESADGSSSQGAQDSPATQVETAAALCPDSDGDGWGYVNGMSCRVGEAASLSDDVQSVEAVNCPDSDGDGWGFINGMSCRVGEVVATVGDVVQEPAHCPDSDGDGWGFINGRSCRVGEVVTTIGDVVQEPALCPDSDGDGWGFINGMSCRVGEEPSTMGEGTSAFDDVEQPLQAAHCPDSDGDGWGFVNGSSCRVQDDATQVSSPVTLVAEPQQSNDRTVEDTIAWDLLQTADGSAPVARHEATAVAVNNRIYLLGGRGRRPVNSYDPNSRRWQSHGNPPVEFSHFQAVAIGSKIYVLGAFTGSFPAEDVDASIRVFDTVNHHWSVAGQMPRDRLRGSAGTVVYNGKIYLLGGNPNGHQAGAVKWFDEYDPRSGQWKRLADAPDARDHFHAVIVDGRLVAAGGRRTAHPNTFGDTVGAVNVYDFSTARWSREASIPTQRAGTMALGVGDEAIVIGGESGGSSAAHKAVQAFNVNSGRWRSLQSLIVGRHGGGAAVVNGSLHVISGNTSRGGGNETQLHEFMPIN